jgi:hypothetical protein
MNIHDPRLSGTRLRLSWCYNINVSSKFLFVKVGDELIEINGQSTFNMNHGDAIDAIKRGGNSLNVVVRRSGKQPYMCKYSLAL